MMTEQQNMLDVVCSHIRAESAQGRLCPLSLLPGLAHEAEAAAPAAVTADQLAELLAESTAEDISLMRGTAEIYYFSEQSMTAAYARHLFRVAEKDPLRLIADTARDESRVYPRPTPLASFMAPPFSLSAAAVDEALQTIASRTDYADIASCVASNGDRYIYSSQFLSAPLAESLAEWAAVGERENP